VARNAGSSSAENTALISTPTQICSRDAPPFIMQISMYTMPRAEQPSPIIIKSRRSYRSASAPAGTLSSSVGRKPSRVTSAMLAALPVCWKM